MSNYYTSSAANTPSGPPRPYPFAHAGHSAGSTPSRSPSIPFQTSNVRGAGPSHSPAFTPAMRDRQARGKDAYAGSGSDEYDDDDYDYDDVDMQDYDTPQRPPPGGTTTAAAATSSSGAGGGRLRPRHVSRVNRHDASDSSDFDDYDYDAHGHDFVGGISAMTRFSPAVGGSRNALPMQSPGVGSGRQRGESFESWRRREHARDVLEQPELLMWYAASREDSIPGTRLYYTRILCGLEEEEQQVQSNKSRAPRKSGGNMSATRA